MSERATLEALLARVLNGEGPDRELDGEIALAFGIVSSRSGNFFYGHKHYSVMVLDRDYYDHDGNAPELPPFTGSLDAALTLVPEGCEWLRKTPQTMTVYRVPDDLKEWARHIDSHAATPARALIAACLKARMEAQGE